MHIAPNGNLGWWAMPMLLAVVVLYNSIAEWLVRRHDRDHPSGGKQREESMPDLLKIKARGRTRALAGSAAKRRKVA